MASSDDELLKLLPPLPKPDRSAQRGESLMGTMAVISIIGCCVAGTYGGCHIMEFEGPHYWPSAPTTLLTAVYAEAAVAIACLAGLLLADPGVVKRSRETCLPVPEEIALALRAGEAPSSVVNIEVGERSYCVRCNVWRNPQPTADDVVSPLKRCLVRCGLAMACDGGFAPGYSHRYHHCSTCQRCVAYFDHHCGFFGRCIAGRGCGGNMGFFKTIIGMGSLGAFTAGTSLVLGLLTTDGYTYFIGIGLMIYMGIYAVGLLCSGIFVFFMHILPSKSSSYSPMMVTDSARATYANRSQASQDVATAEPETIGNSL